MFEIICIKCGKKIIVNQKSEKNNEYSDNGIEIYSLNYDGYRISCECGNEINNQIK